MREAAGPEYSGPAYDRPALLQALPSIITVTGILGTVLIFILGTKSGIGYDDCMAFNVAYRLSTIKNCDRIICLDGGRIVEEGTYDELMEKKGFFAEMVSKQQLDK
ncbi:MAG: hypothetical protein K6E90_01750 [Lachnospiraceae bacterium]|nr:hypothetical protein [Lachnospiraceae bacterium]